MGAGDLVEVAEGMDEVPPTPVAREMDVRMPWEREVGNESGVKGEKELRKEMSVALDQVSQKCVPSLSSIPPLSSVFATSR